MEIGFIYFCNSCEMYGIYSLGDVYTDLGDRSIYRQIQAKVDRSNMRCTCGANKNFFKKERILSMQEAQEYLNELSKNNFVLT